ncbi:hypothetical protein D3C73_1217660 [compost metagenome]
MVYQPDVSSKSMFLFKKEIVLLALILRQTMIPVHYNWTGVIVLFWNPTLNPLLRQRHPYIMITVIMDFISIYCATYYIISKGECRHLYV